jgi:hypothetical protein
VGTLAVIYGSSLQVPAEQRARSYTYFFGLLAYAAWALGISTGFRHLVGLSDDWCGIILAIAALLLPAFDAMLSHGRARASDKARTALASGGTSEGWFEELEPRIGLNGGSRSGRHSYRCARAEKD